MDILIEINTGSSNVFSNVVVPLLTLVLAGLNILLLARVFKFDQKMSQSKLSLSPLTIPSMFLRMESGSGLEKMKLEINKKFYFQENKELNSEFTGEGFPVEDFRKEQEERENLVIKVKNRGDLPSTNIKISLELAIYKTKIHYDSKDPDGIDILKECRELHTTKAFTIIEPYMGADEERYYALIELYDQFRESELILKSIEANGHVYFKAKRRILSSSPTIIHYHRHSKLDNLSDVQDSRDLYGHKNLWTNDKDK